MSRPKATITLALATALLALATLAPTAGSVQPDAHIAQPQTPAPQPTVPDTSSDDGNDADWVPACGYGLDEATADLPIPPSAQPLVEQVRDRLPAYAPDEACYLMALVIDLITCDADEECPSLLEWILEIVQNVADTGHQVIEQTTQLIDDTVPLPSSSPQASLAVGELAPSTAPVDPILATGHVGAALPSEPTAAHTSPSPASAFAPTTEAAPAGSSGVQDPGAQPHPTGTPPLDKVTEMADLAPLAAPAAPAVPAP